MTRVLIVDDKEENLYLLRALFTGHGWEVAESRHGAEALVQARLAPPHLVISDLLMPVMDGYTLLRHWKADGRLKNIPFIVYTATYTEPKDEQLALDLGADAFILKPAEPERFMARIREVLAKDARRELRPAHTPHGGEKVLLKEYSEALVRKLEEKALQLEAANTALQQEIAERKQAEALLNGQKQILEMMAAGAPLAESLAALVRFIESRAPGMLGSILLLDADGVHVRHGAAPSLPGEFNTAVDGQPIGPSAGSCGTAAYRKEAVVVEDIATDPRWAVYKAAALPHGLRACWSTPIFDAQKNVLGTFAMYYRQPGRPPPEHRRLIDIATHTAAIAIGRHRSEAALRAKTGELDRYFTNSLDLLCIADAAGHFRRLNPEWERTLGYPVAELEGRRLLDFVHPDDAEKTQAALARLAAGENVLNFVNRYRHQDGSYRWVEWRAYAEDHRIFAVARNITERIRSEQTVREKNQLAQQISMIASTAPGALASCRLRPDGRIGFPYASPAWLAMFGVTREEVAEDAGPLLKQIHPDDVARFQSTIQQSAQSMTDWRDEFRILRPDQGQRWIAGHSTPVREPDGSILWHGFVTDITERKRSEVVLRESEERFASAFHTSPAAITITRIADGKFVDANQAFLDLFEFSRDEVIGHTSTELGILNAGERGRLIQAQMASGGLQNAELLSRSKSGRSLHLLFSSRSMAIAGEAHHVTTLIDITERKQAEAALRESEARLRLSVAAANIGLWDWDLATNEVYFSREWKGQLGYAEAEIFNRFDEWESRVHPDDLAPTLAKVREFLTNPSARYEVEFRMRHKDGSFRWIFTQAQILRDAAGKALRMMGCHIDMTERKQTEAAVRDREKQLSLVYENVHDVLFVVAVAPDGDFHFASVNRRFLEATGLTRDQVVGRRVADAIPESAHALVLGNYRTSIRSRQPVSWEEVSAYPTGRKCGVVTVAPVFDVQGNCTQLIGTVYDITERKQAENEIRLAAEQLRELAARVQAVREEERTSIAREIHDVLAQELTRLKIDLVWLAKRLVRPVEEPTREVLAARLADTIAQADTAISTVQRIATDLRPVILDSLGLPAAVEWQVEDFARRTGLACQARAALGETALARDRATALFRILQESLTNIARHAQASAVEVELTEEGGAATLTVRDNGVGISRVQLNDSHSIGLLGMRERALAFGGTVEIVGSPGEGTSVIVRLPRESPGRPPTLS